MILADGYSEVPEGKLAAVVTYLEMLAQPELRAERGDAPWQLQRIEHPDSLEYRELFRRIGAEWLWFSRLAMPLGELGGILSSPAVEVYSLALDGRDEGLLELDFREEGHCELAFYGLSEAVRGQGAGRWLMNRAIERAWAWPGAARPGAARPIARFWVHTCTHDHPQALAFYLRSGFRAYARRVEIADDPRLTGQASRSSAAHIPIIEPSQP